MTFRMAILAAAMTLLATTANAVEAQSFGGRDMLVYVPQHPAPEGQRALVVVLHGALGNAGRIADEKSETAMNLDEAAEKNGFVVAYLNGTGVMRFFQSKMLGWNAGACCGLPAKNNVDDVAYIRDAVHNLERRYGIARGDAFVIGHSNGAMMALRMMCETQVFAAAVSISGALEAMDQTCPDARGKRILAIHGVNDDNVPVAGGVGKGLSDVNYKPEAYAAKVFRNSGADYDLRIVPGADHFLKNIDAALVKTEGVSVSQKAVRFFGLDKPVL